MPYLELIAFDKKSGLRLIQFESCDRIRYVNKHFVEQSLPINVEIDET